MVPPALISLALVLPIVAVERAPSCPTVETIVEELDLQLEAWGRPGASAGAEGEYRLRVDGSAGFRVELADAAGRVVLVRELPAGGTTCEASARAIAVIVERWLAGLAVPPVGLTGLAPSPPPRRHRVVTQRAQRFEARAGPTLAAGIDPAGAFAGLGIGAELRALAWLALSIDGAVHLPHNVSLERGAASIVQGGLRLRAAVAPIARRVRVEVGPSVRLDIVSVSVTGPSERTSVRSTPAMGVAWSVSLPMAARTRLALILDCWVALDGQTFFVRDGERQHDVYSTPLAGLQVDIVVSHGLF